MSLEKALTFGLHRLEVRFQLVASLGEVGEDPLTHGARLGDHLASGRARLLQSRLGIAFGCRAHISGFGRRAFGCLSRVSF